MHAHLHASKVCAQLAKSVRNWQSIDGAPYTRTVQNTSSRARTQQISGVCPQPACAVMQSSLSTARSSHYLR